MKKRTSSMSRRIVSLLMSLVLTLTLVTPAAFAEGMGVYASGEGTTVTTPADIATQEGEDTSVSVAQRTVTVKQYHANEAYEVKIVVGVEEGVEKLDTTYTIDADTKTVTLKLTTDGYDGEPVYIKTALDDVLVTEGENQTPALTKDTPELEYALPEDGDVTLYYGTQEDFNAPATQRTVTVEQYRANEAYDVKLVVGVEEDGTTEKLDITYAIGADTKTVTLKLTTADYAGEPIYIKTALDDVLVTEGENQTPALTTDTLPLEYTLPEDGDVTLYCGTQADFASAWYGDGSATEYTIRTAEELANFAQLVNSRNNFSGKTVTLARDIDLSAVCHPADESYIVEASWTPIGTSQKKFAGKFDGQGYTISGLYINRASTYQGLFGYITKDAVIQNLIATGKVDAGSKTQVGGIVGATINGATVQNCGFYGAVTAKPGVTTTGGVVGAGKALNCWYYRSTDESATELGVCGKKNGATNCYQNVSATVNTKGNYAKSLNTKDVVDGLNTGNTAAGKVWAVDPAEGALYPKLIDPLKTITMQPVFPDCTAVVSANGTALTAANGYTYEVTADAVIKVSGNSGPLYYAASESEKGYKPGGNLTMLESSTTFNKSDLPKTYYYGTEEDFQLLAAWNSAFTSEKSAIINTSYQLKVLARMVNRGKDNMAGKTIALGASIDLSDIDWTPIGTAENPFKGAFTITGNYSISNLPNDLFGVVDGGTVNSMTINGGTGRLVSELKSGTVAYCMSTAQVTDEEGGGLVGTNNGTVQNSYYYNAKSRNTVVASGGITNCYYLADTSTWGQTGDAGARTAAEFEAGRVTWELGSSWGANASDNLPCLGSYKKLYQLTLTKLGDAGVDGVTIENDNALTNGDTQYLYGTAETEVRLKETISDGSTITYSPAKPEKIQDPKNNSTVNTYYYTIGEKVDADISWYKDADNEFTLTNAAELFGLAQLVNGGTNFANKTIKLGADIDLTGYIWTPIGGGNYFFKGVFDGGNHKITSMNVRAADTHNVGLFSYVSGGTVKNLQVGGSVSYTGNTYVYGDVGGIVGCLGDSGAVTNCLSKVTVEGSGKIANVGGVVGNLITGTINLCWNEGTVNGGSGSVGGIVGINSNGTVTNCANFGEVKGSSTASGIVGSGAVANSYNLGDVTGAKGRAYGISNGTVANSYYVCKLNDTDKKAYVNNASENEVKYNEADKTYTVGEGAALLVDKLNENRSGTPWFVNQDEGVYLPIHVLDWTGKQDERFIGKIITITYDPNGGVNKDGGYAPISVPVTLMPNLSTGGFETVQYTILAANDETLGFKHENGTIKATPWNTARDGTGTGYNAGSSIDISASESEGITLYAQWDAIWVGTGTKSDPYQIPSIDELTKLQEQVNENGFSYTGKWFRLTNNIDLNDELWTPIGVDADHPFSGNLDGSNHAISGLNVDAPKQWAGFFGYVDSPAGNAVVMRELTLKNGSVKATRAGTSACGGLVACAWDGIILNDVTVEGFTVEGGINGTGGLVGRGPAEMTNCHNKGGSVTGEYAGGLAGMTYTNSPDYTFTGCTNSAAVFGTKTAGGMTGGAFGSHYISCTNSGKISASFDEINARACGIAWGGRYEHCSNSGVVTGKQAAGIGVSGTIATRCSNTGAVKGTEYAAGILTNTGYGGVTEFCWNTGKVEASTPVKAFGILYGYDWGANNKVRNSFSYVPGANIGLAPTELKEKNVSDSYYLADKKDSVSSVGEWASADDFASGKVAWGVDGGVNAHKNYWTQGANNYPVPIGEGTSTSYYRAKAECGTGGAVSIKSSRNFTGDADNAVYGPKGTSVTVTATPKDDTFGLKSLTLDLMGTGSTTALESGDGFTLGEANALVVATFASTGNGGSGGGTGGNGGDGDGSGTDTGDGAGDEDDEGLQDGLNMDVEYNIKGLVLAAYAEWGANGGGKTFVQWLKASPSVLRAFITNSLDNMAAAAKSKDTDEARGLAALLLASLNEHSGLNSKSGDTIAKALQRYMDTGSEATFSTWLTTGSGMASGTVEEILAQYTDSLLNLTERLYANWESSGTSLTFPQWLDAQQVTMESLSENAEEPEAEPDDTQTSEAPEDVPDGQEAEGGASGGGNSVWEVIGTVVRENPIIVWSIVAVVAALIIVGAVRRYHKVKRDERDDVASKK